MNELFALLKEYEDTLFIFASIGAIIMGLLVILWRNNETKTPLHLKKIIIPPIMMSTGALMFLFPYFRLDNHLILEAVIVGIIFSFALLLTTKYEVKDDELYVKASKLFPVILVGLLIIRTFMKTILSQEITPGEIGGMFFLLAFTMIVIWRTSMVLHYLQFKKKQG
ncbi:CcdC family protein [Nosocomiicoccus sp. HMSC059G07]|uniref:CcdC family protein n=1 Tax=Nosocomiicoccus sp. HMSC059G07 TaxID=1739531 RepID=UPI0008A396FE|nr:cytochrome c biogenesis protein CcdC [Nosocomiicoccus sp. HMSC059G07]OFO51805.1 cytochrome C biogenesis protein CcdC [Nosocomiicoccus sp. HMSC059G07]